MIDLNDYGEEPSRFDLDEIRERLAATAASWIPQMFPAGVMARDRRSIRCGDLTGRAPSGEGSCVMHLTGPRAGTAYDFAEVRGAGPIDLIEYGTGLSGKALFEEAARIAGTGPIERPKWKQRDPAQDAERLAREIERIVERCEPLAGSLGVRYLEGRGLSVPDCPDLLFSPDLTDRDTNRGYNGLVAIVRNEKGERTGGILRIFLTDEGTAKAEPGKKMLGAVAGGAVQLAPIGPDGHIGIAEGLETSLAVTQLFGVPCWASLSTSGMKLWNPPANVRRVTIFADAGEPGIAAANALADRLRAAGIECDIRVPMHGDDFNDDLQRGCTAESYPAEVVARAPSAAIPETAEDFARAVDALAQDPSDEAVSRLIAALGMRKLEPIAEAGILQRIKRVVRVDLGTLKAQLNIVKKRFNATGDVTRELPKPAWFGRLRVDVLGNPERNEANIMIAFGNDDAFAGRLVFDEFHQQIMAANELPWDAGKGLAYPRHWTDVDDIRAAEWLQLRGLNIAPSTAYRGVVSLANEQIIHPVREFLRSLSWDGRERLERWALDYLGAEDTRLHRAFGSLWMISAVARIMQPGCKADHMLILEGPQGARKSTALKALAGEQWFTDELADIGSKDASQQMCGIWIIEIAELDAMGRAEVSKIKAFLTRTTDRYRPPYGRQQVKIPRQCVFAGTVNPDTYLRDETGNRRFWPVRCGTIDIAAIKRDREQLWAEAVELFNNGAVWWLTDEEMIEEARDEQQARFQTDAWDSLIDDWLENDGVIKRLAPIRDVSIAEIMEKALRIEPGKWTRSDQMRVSAYLKLNGWDRYNSSSGSNRTWRYRR
jgi:putative DNA primase/helicase